MQSTAAAAAALMFLPVLTTSAHAAPAKWPGDSSVAIADDSDVFGNNLSGLSFQGADVLWAVRNGPSSLFRLVRDGAKWRPDSSGGWSSGKSLKYADGGSDPDAEAVVSTPDGLVVATERDGSGKSSAKILRYSASASGSSLKANATWDLTSDLPKFSSNKGPEAISWIPDSALTAAKFVDERTKAAYNPASYPGHGSGLYFVGLESNGTIYAYALNQSSGSYTRIASFGSGQSTNMELEYEPETGRLWATCDNHCGGATTTLAVNAQGKFAVTATYARPSGLGDFNTEGFAIAPGSTCTAGRKPVVWADDDNNDGHALRSGNLPC